MDSTVATAAAAPMRRLRPTSVGGVFDAAFDLYKQDFVLFAGIAAVLQIPAQLIIAAASIGTDFDHLDEHTRGANSAETIFVAVAVMFVALVAYHLLYVLQSGALSLAVFERNVGRRVTIGSAYRRLLPSVIKLAVTWIIVDIFALMAAMIVGIAMVFVLGLLTAAGLVATRAGGEPGTALMVWMIILMFVLPTIAFAAVGVSFAAFTTQITVIEGTGYMGALQRNWTLLRGRFWALVFGSIGIVVIVLALRFAVEGAIELALNAFVYTWMPAPTIVKQVVEHAIEAITALFMQPFIMISLTLLYFDQRMRREGFDLIIDSARLQASSPAEARI